MCLCFCSAANMSSAFDRIAKSVVAQKKKDMQKSVAHSLLDGGSGAPLTGSGTSSSGPSPSADLTPRNKRTRSLEVVDLEKMKVKEKYPVPSVFNNKRFFEEHPLYVHRAESLSLGKMSLDEKKAQMAKDAAAMMRVMSIAALYTGEETPEAL